jgi:hypothetical protein
MDSYSVCQHAQYTEEHEDTPPGACADMMPETKETFEHLPQMAVAAVLSEYVDRSLVNAYLLTPMKTQKASDVFNLKQWFSYCFQNSACVTKFQELVLDDTGAWFYGDENVAQYQSIFAVLRQHSSAISRKIDRILDLNLAMCKWIDLVRAGLSPYSASHFLLSTRDCEHVILTPKMLEWMKSVPGSTPETVYKRIPDVAPTDPTLYQMLEYWCRRSQRIVFMGQTSRQCDILINH